MRPRASRQISQNCTERQLSPDTRLPLWFVPEPRWNTPQRMQRGTKGQEFPKPTRQPIDLNTQTRCCAVKRCSEVVFVHPSSKSPVHFGVTAASYERWQRCALRVDKLEVMVANQVLSDDRKGKSFVDPPG